MWRIDQPLCLQLPAGLFSAPGFAEGTDKEVKFKSQLQQEFQTGFYTQLLLVLYATYYPHSVYTPCKTESEWTAVKK